jgi:hypothetical protein
MSEFEQWLADVGGRFRIAQHKSNLRGGRPLCRSKPQTAHCQSVEHAAYN